MSASWNAGAFAFPGNPRRCGKIPISCIAPISPHECSKYDEFRRCNATNTRGRIKMTRWQDDLQFYWMHFMPYIHLPPDLARYDSLWVDFPNKFYDPQERPRTLQSLHRRARAGRQARLRRAGRERAPQHRLQHDAGLQPDRRGAHSADQARQDLLLRHADQSRISRTGWPRSTRCST